MSEQHDEQTIGRRRLLRRAGTVAAGVAGAGVVSAAAAGPAQAAPGDPVVQGATNNAAASTTGITSNGAGATLELSNTQMDANSLASAPLRLVPRGDGLRDNAPVGSLGMDRFNTLWVADVQIDGVAYSNYLHTSGNSNRIVPIRPQRVVNTTTAAGRANIINPGSLDSSGRLKGGSAIHIDLSQYMFYADAVFGNLTITGATVGQFASVYPYGTPWPGTSTINYRANTDIANGFTVAVGYEGDVTDAISVYSHGTTHVILDITAVVIGVGAVNPDITSSGAASARTAGAQSSREELAKKGKPSWDK